VIDHAADELNALNHIGRQGNLLLAVVFPLAFVAGEVYAYTLIAIERYLE
jgi:hypothetical protein